MSRSNTPQSSHLAPSASSLGKQTKQKPRWIPDKEAPSCMSCIKEFNIKRRRHHCRLCGHVVCGKCSANKIRLKGDPVRVCDDCFLSFNVSKTSNNNNISSTTLNGNGHSNGNSNSFSSSNRNNNHVSHNTDRNGYVYPTKAIQEEPTPAQVFLGVKPQPLLHNGHHSDEYQPSYHSESDDGGQMMNGHSSTQQQTERPAYVSATDQEVAENPAKCGCCTIM